MTSGTYFLVSGSLLTTDLKIVSCDRYSTSKYSWPSASTTDTISVIFGSESGIVKNLVKLPADTVCVLTSPDITRPIAFTAKEVGLPS